MIVIVLNIWSIPSLTSSKPVEKSINSSKTSSNSSKAWLISLDPVVPEIVFELIFARAESL